MSRTISKTLLAIGLLLSIPTASFAVTTYNGTGLVYRLEIDSTAMGADQDYVYITTFTSAGTCGTASGFVRLHIKNDDQGKRQESLLMAAFLAGKQVTVQTDDTTKIGTECYLRYVNIQ